MGTNEKTVAAGEFKQTCLRLLDEVNQAGFSIVITKRGKPVAQLVPLDTHQRRHHWPDLSSYGSIREDIVVPAEGLEAWSVLAEPDESGE